jgi:hypothetical protein
VPVTLVPHHVAAGFFRLPPPLLPSLNWWAHWAAQAGEPVYEHCHGFGLCATSWRLPQ